jgi:AcrR family transcriptional regulator
MPRNGQDTRRKIIDAAYDMFYRQGFNRTGVNEIAKTAGITKRTLYSHFESKDTLLETVLEQQHELGLSRIRQWADRQPGDLATAIETLFADLVKWSKKPRWTGSGFTRLAMELADMPGHPARIMARKHKKAIEQCLSDVLLRFGYKDAAARALDLVILIEGTTALILLHGETEYANHALKAAKKLLAD